MLRTFSISDYGLLNQSIAHHYSQTSLPISVHPQAEDRSYFAEALASVFHCPAIPIGYILASGAIGAAIGWRLLGNLPLGASAAVTMYSTSAVIYHRLVSPNKNQVDTLKNAIVAACTEVHKAAIKYQEAVSDNKEIQKLIPSLNKCIACVKSISTPTPSLAGFIGMGASIIALTIGLKTSITISAAALALYSAIIAIYDARKAEHVILANFEIDECNSTIANLSNHNGTDVKAEMTQFIMQNRPQPSAAS